MIPRRLSVDVQLEFERPGAASRELWSILSDYPTTARAFIRDGGGEKLAVEAPGRCLLQDGSEMPCQIEQFNPAGFSVRGMAGGRLGEWIVVNGQHLGVVEGVIIRKAPALFVVDIRSTPVRLERLASRIDWWVRRRTDQAPERREHERVAQHRRKGKLRTLDGREIEAELLDASAGGAALSLGAAALYLWVGQPIWLEERAARVLRAFPGGVVVTFDDAQP